MHNNNELPQAAALTNNADAVKKAQDTVRKLASASTGRVRRSSSHQALKSCTEVKKVAISLTTLVQKNPASHEVSIKASMIIASSEVKCTSEEKTALSSLEAAFERAKKTIEEALKDVQKEFVTLTGSTASPEVIAEKTTTATTSTAAPQGNTFIDYL